jgi:7-cyano-7-deazaguanine synthase
MAEENKTAVVLLSGGLDSATALAVARRDGFRCHALTIAYGQRHAVELEAAKRVAIALSAVEHRTIHLDLRGFGGSALTSDTAVPKDRAPEAMQEAIPITYVPARNTVFLSLALAWAEVLESFDIYLGVNALDYSGYPDCRPEFVNAFENIANLATKAGVEKKGAFRIHAPLIHLSKADIIRLGNSGEPVLKLPASLIQPGMQSRPTTGQEYCRGVPNHDSRSSLLIS